MTAPTYSLSPSPSTSPKGEDQLARVAGKPLPKSDEKRSSRAFKSFLGKTGLIDLLRARGRGLSTAAHSNKSLECQAKNDLHPTRNQIKTGAFSGDQFGDHLGIIWGSFGDQLKLISMSHVTIPWFAWVVIGDEQEE